MAKQNPYVAIAAVLAGIYLAIVVLFLVFERGQLALISGILVPVAWAFTVMAVLLGFFASHKK